MPFFVYLDHLFQAVVKDISPEGHRILLPFFTSTDMLVLSECCHDLLAYRTFMSTITTTNDPVGCAGVKQTRDLLGNGAEPKVKGLS